MIESLKTQGDLHLARKAFHMLSILGILMCMTFLSPARCWLIYFIIGVPMMAADYLRRHSTSLNHWVLKFLGPVFRRHEFKELSGSSYAILGIGLCFFLFPKPISLLSVLFLAVGDPTASFFGLKFGKTKIFGKKSLVGFLAAISFCSLSALLFFGTYGSPVGDTSNLSVIALSLACGVVGGTSELIPIFKLDDNLTQPLLNGLLLSLLFWQWGGVIYG